ncbi:MAG: isopentenyl phosphate kinase [Candidatus Thalassarchaeaceae archaeon]
MSVKGRIVIKLGGGLITNKNKVKTLDKDAINKVCEIIKILTEEEYRIIIVHGAGSYGHILSKEMKISEGINHEIYEKQIKAVKQIRDDMKELNNEVIDSLKKVNLHSVGFPPSIWAMNTGKDFIGNIDIFEKEIGEMIPICFGDVVQRDDENEFGILSGDDLMYRLSMEIPEVNFTVFLLGDVDGVMDKPPDNLDANLIPTWKKYDSIRTSHNSEVDVTGGMDLKLLRASEIANKIENVWFLNGNNPERILQLVRTGSTIGTKINP